MNAETQNSPRANPERHCKDVTLTCPYAGARIGLPSPKFAHDCGGWSNEATRSRFRYVHQDNFLSFERKIVN
jgi:hypothetical protein